MTNPNANEIAEAIKTFRTSKPWRGTVAERQVKFQTLHETLCAFTGCDWILNTDLVREPETERGDGGLRQGTKEIVLAGKLSVVTYLFCFGGAAFGFERGESLAWAEALYQRIFPASAHGMLHEGELIVKPCTGAGRN